MTEERRRDIETFSRHAPPGVTLLAKLPAPEPLYKRCGCGQKISHTRARCMACQQEVLQELASQIADQGLLDAVLRQSFPEMRTEMIRDLTPYLSFVPNK